MIIKNQTHKEHRPLLDFYICMNDLCSFFGTHGGRAAGDNNMTEETCPVGYYQGHPLCLWCDSEMEVAHTDELANSPHIQWDGTLESGEKYYQLKF